MKFPDIEAMLSPYSEFLGCCRCIIFRQVNEKYGRMLGNTLLYRVSEIIKQAVVNNGFAARWGRGEFIGVIYATEEEATRILDAIVDGVAGMCEQDVDNLTLSLGAALITAGEELDTMTRKAYAHMSYSRINGRNQKTIYK